MFLWDIREKKEKHYSKGPRLFKEKAISGVARKIIRV